MFKNVLWMNSKKRITCTGGGGVNKGVVTVQTMKAHETVDWMLCKTVKYLVPEENPEV